MNRRGRTSSNTVPRFLRMPFAQGIALLYLLVSGLWIFFSDWLAEILSTTQNQLRLISTYKGWFFVLITTALLFLILTRFITKIKRTQQQLRESEERLKLATSAADIGVWDRDILNDQLIWNEWMYSIYGISPDESDGTYQVWQKRVHPDDLQAASTAVIEAEQGKKEFNTEFRIIRPDGEIRYIRAFGKVIRADNGTPIRMIGINYDITDRKQSEQQAQSQLNELNRWHQVTLGREIRILELKKEINEILERNGKPPRYKETADGLQKDSQGVPRI